MSAEIPHVYPENGEHFWSDWMHATGLPKPTQYRHCLVKGCKAVERREAAQA